MAEASSVSRAVMASAPPLPQAAGATLYWNGSKGEWGDVEPQTLSAWVRQPSFQAKGPTATAHHDLSYWRTREIGCVPGIPPQAIEWEQEAAFMTFPLAPLAGAASILSISAVHPAMLVQASYAS